MRAISTERGIKITMFRSELRILIVASKKALEMISLAAFHPRFGCEKDEYVQLFNPIENIYLDKEQKKSSPAEELDIYIPEDDLYILPQTLNAICNGLRIERFEEVIGLSKEEVRAILSDLLEIQDTIRKIPT